MSEKADDKVAGNAGGEQDNGLTLDLNFAPSWARTDPGESLQRYRQEDFAGHGDPAVPSHGGAG
ncbi:MAG: hypothetical protein J5985_05510, partial [Kiritimatiellae bacterium]|nr:hypothetical protein [Kiritimatiellia bacterium]